jgi:hypothetical protein
MLVPSLADRQAEYHTEGPCRGAGRVAAAGPMCESTQPVHFNAHPFELPVDQDCPLAVEAADPLVCGSGRDGRPEIASRPGTSSLRSAAHSARIHARYCGGTARNPQITRGIFLARSTTGRDFRGV